MALNSVVICISLNDVKNVDFQGKSDASSDWMVKNPKVLDDQIGEWWVEEDLNLRPHAYQACALTT